MGRLHRPLFVVLALPLSGCLQFFPEAALSLDEPTDAVAARVASALGVEFKGPVERASLDADAFASAKARAIDRRPAAKGHSIDERCWNALRGAPSAAPPAAAAQPGASDTILFDLRERSARLVESSATAAANDPTDARNRGIARATALAQALAAQHAVLPDAEENLDAREASLALIAGAAHVAALEASLSPVAAFDASAAPIRRLHSELTSRLLADPDGAPAELLGTKDLPDVERFALERLLTLSGTERWRAIVRVFAGARFVLEAKDRLSNSQLAMMWNDPPRSTEQVIHPDAYFDQDDLPGTIRGSGRDGLIGHGFTLVSTGSAGESGLYAMLRGALDAADASTAAAGWSADLLTVYDDATNHASGFAWRLEFDDRWDAMQAEDAFDRATRARFGGAFVEASDGLRQLNGGTTPVAMQRDTAGLAIVIGGDAERQRPAITHLLTKETASAPPKLAPGSRQDFVFRAFRYLASPFLFDCRGRFDTDVRSLYGVFFDHRVFPGGAEHSLFNPTEFPYLSRLLPEEARGLAFLVERGPTREDFGVLMSVVRSFGDDSTHRDRFWSPLYSRTHTDDFSSFGVLYGLLWEHADGAGRHALSPRPLFSNETGLDGAERRGGALFDAVNWMSRDGMGTRFALLPYGILADVRSTRHPDGVDFGLLFDQIRVRTTHVVADTSAFDFTLLSGWLTRIAHDGAAGTSETSFAKGLLFGVETSPERSAGGLFRILGRSFLGWSSGPEGTRAQVLWLEW